MKYRITIDFEIPEKVEQAVMERFTEMMTEMYNVFTRLLPGINPKIHGEKVYR